MEFDQIFVSLNPCNYATLNSITYKLSSNSFNFFTSRLSRYVLNKNMRIGNNRDISLTLHYKLKSRIFK